MASSSIVSSAAIIWLYVQLRTDSRKVLEAASTAFGYIVSMWLATSLPMSSAISLMMSRDRGVGSLVWTASAVVGVCSLILACPQFAPLDFPASAAASAST